MKDVIILFLDIDGVLCTSRSHYAFGDKGGLKLAWDVTCCQMIRRLCMDYKCKLVISSVWRKPNRFSVFRQYLCTYGLIDHTYSSLFKDPWYREFVPGDWMTPVVSKCQTHRERGTEIREWLKKHPKVKHYLIIDDSNDMFRYQMPYLVLTDCDEGFGALDFEKCEKFLRKWRREKCTKKL